MDKYLQEAFGGIQFQMMVPQEVFVLDDILFALMDGLLVQQEPVKHEGNCESSHLRGYLMKYHSSCVEQPAKWKRLSELDFAESRKFGINSYINDLFWGYYFFNTGGQPSAEVDGEENRKKHINKTKNKNKKKY